MRWIVTAVFALGVLGCQETEPEQTTPFASTEEVVLTSFYPMTWMCESLLQDIVPVECVLPKDQQADSWQPDADSIQKLQSARLIVVNGTGYESWLNKVTLPPSRVVDTTAGFPQPFIRYENGVTHQHGPVGSRSMEGVDGHTWLDPMIARHQVERIAEASARIFPDKADQIQKNLRTVHEQLDALDARFKSLTAQLQNTKILCARQNYNYLARRYGWEVQNLDLDMAQQISEEAMGGFKSSEPDQPSVCLWPSAPTPGQVSQLESLGIGSVVFLTGSQPLESGDYVSLMNQNIDRLENAVK